MMKKSGAYCRILAAKGVLDAKKVGDRWVVSLQSVAHFIQNKYTKKKVVSMEVLNEVLSIVASVLNALKMFDSETPTIVYETKEEGALPSPEATDTIQTEEDKQVSQLQEAINSLESVVEKLSTALGGK